MAKKHKNKKRRSAKSSACSYSDFKVGDVIKLRDDIMDAYFDNATYHGSWSWKQNGRYYVCDTDQYCQILLQARRKVKWDELAEEEIKSLVEENTAIVVDKVCLYDVVRDLFRDGTAFAYGYSHRFGTPRGECFTKEWLERFGQGLNSSEEKALKLIAKTYEGLDDDVMCSKIDNLSASVKRAMRDAISLGVHLSIRNDFERIPTSFRNIQKHYHFKYAPNCASNKRLLIMDSNTRLAYVDPKWWTKA